MKPIGLFFCFNLLLHNGFAFSFVQTSDSARTCDGRLELQIEKQKIGVEKEASTNQNLKITRRPVYENPNHGKVMPVKSPVEQKVE